jgi:hypothetical protein
MILHPRTLYDFDRLVCNSARIPVCHGTRMAHVSYAAVMSLGTRRTGMELEQYSIRAVLKI